MTLLVETKAGSLWVGTKLVMYLVEAKAGDLLVATSLSG